MTQATQTPTYTARTILTKFEKPAAVAHMIENESLNAEWFVWRVSGRVRLQATYKSKKHGGKVYRVWSVLYDGRIVD